MIVKKAIKRSGIFILLAALIYILEKWIFPFLFNISILNILINVNGIYYAFTLGLFNIGLSIYLYSRLRKKITDNTNNKYIGFSNIEEEEEKEIKPEHKAILEILVKQDKYTVYRKILWEIIQNVNLGISELKFSLCLKEMQRLGYVTQGSNEWGALITITDKACEKLSRFYIKEGR